MREVSPAEATLIHNAPSRQIAVVDAAMRPEIRSTAARIVERPRRIRKIAAAHLETVLAEVEAVGGITAVISALDADPRKSAQRLRLTYVEPVALTDENDASLTNEMILRHLDTVPSRAVRKAARDVLRRLPEVQRAAFVEELHSSVSGHQFHRGAMFQECASGVVAGLVEFPSLSEVVRDAIVSITAAGLLAQLPTDVVVDALARTTDHRMGDSVINAVWSEGSLTLIDAITTMWRDGRCVNENVHKSIGRLLATRDLLDDGELAEAAKHFGYQAGTTLSLIPPHRRETVLRELPVDLRLRDDWHTRDTWLDERLGGVRHRSP